MVLPSAAFASSGTRTEEPAEVSSNMERARTLFGEGGTAYELADYEKAIEKFEEAYALVVQANAPQKARSRIVLNLAYAHRKEYNLSANELNLRRARELLDHLDRRRIGRVSGAEGGRVLARRDRVALHVEVDVKGLGLDEEELEDEEAEAAALHDERDPPAEALAAPFG